MKYYNFETMFRSLKEILCEYLKNNGFYYELSGAAASWHIEILTDEDGAEMINNFIDSVTLQEVV
jgi:hypothetical protein